MTLTGMINRKIEYYQYQQKRCMNCQTSPGTFHHALLGLNIQIYDFYIEVLKALVEK